MIRYQLSCDHDHSFDAWFRNSAEFEVQKGTTALSCPSCGSTSVSKALMAPAVGAGRASRQEAELVSVAATLDPQKLQLAAADPRRAAFVEALRQMRRMVTENADYVGGRFSEEARKIHYQEVEPRGIYGEATPAEARALIEEGVEVHPLPHVPEDGN